ncbi:hypothetical protein BGZ75_008740 [Mortierella antarctica]|nr:hypothetical protein BGZ75_008740 [Mortierella antarctica]
MDEKRASDQENLSTQLSSTEHIQSALKASPGAEASLSTPSPTPNRSRTATNNDIPDVDMDGVQDCEISYLEVHDDTTGPESSSMAHPSDQIDGDETMSEGRSSPPSLCSDDASDSEEEHEAGSHEDGEEGVSNKENTGDSEQASQEEQPYESSSSAASSSASLQEEPSIIETPDAVYSAVPISSELHIIPRSSKGFNWNQDVFLRPHERQSLGVDEMYSGSEGAAAGGSMSGDSVIPVHEIQLD